MLSSYINIGENHIHFDKIDSTNTFAQNLVSKTNPIEGTVITAAFQTHGKGQFDRIWESNIGENIIMSLILYPSFIPAHQQALLNITITLAILDYLKEYNTGFKIKWPNDIYFAGKKICGILIQNQIAEGHLKNSIVGIGINVNQKEFTGDLANNASSLSIITKKIFDLNTEYKKLWSNLERKYTQLVFRKSNDEFINEYNSNLMYFEKDVIIQNSDTEFTSRVMGIDLNGRLRVFDGLEEKLLNHGEVRIIFD